MPLLRQAGYRHYRVGKQVIYQTDGRCRYALALAEPSAVRRVQVEDLVGSIEGFAGLLTDTSQKEADPACPIALLAYRQQSAVVLVTVPLKEGR